jgi:hypothetical protein
MAQNADRKQKRKRIKFPPDNTLFVDIPVNYDASFITAAEQYQEGHFFFDNSSKSSRKTRVQQVKSLTTDKFIDVERIQSFFTRSAADQYQETEWVLINKDPAPVQPSGEDSPAHQKKHVVRFFKDNDESSEVWVDVEQIDQLNAALPQEQYQEYELYIRNDDKGDPVDNSKVPYDVTKGFCDPGLDLADSEDGFDPPYRIDPLQNIVNWHGQEGGVSVSWSFVRETTGIPAISSATWIRMSSIGGAGTRTVVITHDATVSPQSFSPTGGPWGTLGEAPVQTSGTTLSVAIFGTPLSPPDSPEVPTGDVALFSLAGVAVTVDGVDFVLATTFISSIKTLDPLQSKGTEVVADATFVPPS